MPDRRSRPRVLLVTGTYFPEISAAGLQCRAIAAALGGRAAISVVATSVDPTLARRETVDAVAVRRIHIDVRSRWSRASAAVRLAAQMLQTAGSYDIIHIHGFSQKNVPVSILGRLLGKPVVLTLHTAGQDEAQVVRRQGAIAYWAFTHADLVTCVSPQLRERWQAAGLPAERVRLTPNGIDTRRFCPAEPGERAALRDAFGWPANDPVILFVGFFSRDKRPDLLFRAWRTLRHAGIRARLAFLGATDSGYFEIDRSLADTIASEAAVAGLGSDLMFIPPTQEVDRYLRAADVYVLPSIREAHPLALLEAMSSALPCVATRLAGATDVLIEDGVSGRLFRADDETALAAALAATLADPAGSRVIGARARAVVTTRYDMQRIANDWLSIYEGVLAGPR